MRSARGGMRRCRAGGREFTAAVVRRTDGAAVVELHGELDLRSSGELRAILQGLADDGCRHLVADFSAVRFCDAAGLGALVAVSNRLRADGGDLRLTGVRAAQRRILHITHLDELFRPHDPAEDAL